MQVHPISNNQQTFNGYIKPKYRKAIENSLKKTFKKYKTFERKEIYDTLLEQGKSTLEKLEKFVAPLQKDTYIEICNDGCLYLSNPIPTDKSNSYFFREGFIKYNVDSYKSRFKVYKTDLERIGKIVDAASVSIKPKEINETFLEMAERDLENYKYKYITGISFIDNFFINKKVKQIEEYAKSIGKTTNARTIAEKRYEELMEIKLNKAKEKKEDNRLIKQFNSDVQELSGTNYMCIAKYYTQILIAKLLQ